MLKLVKKSKNRKGVICYHTIYVTFFCMRSVQITSTQVLV